VLFYQKYGADFGHAVIGSTISETDTCHPDQEHYDTIHAEFVTYLLSGEIKTLLSDAQAVSLQLDVLADALGSQSTFSTTSAFTITFEDGYLITTGLTVSPVASNMVSPVVPDAGSWDEATAAAAVAISASETDEQFDPIAALSGAALSGNVDQLRTHLGSFQGLRVDAVMTAWGENGSRLFSRVTMGSKYMVVDTHLGLAHGPYEVDPLEQPYVGDALSPYMANYMSKHVAVMATLTPCNGNPDWNPGTTPKPAWWPAMPAWPVTPAPARPTWNCQSEGAPTSSCRCQTTRTSATPCNCRRRLWWTVCDTCEERIECLWTPGGPDGPSSCTPGTGIPVPGLPDPPAGNVICDEYWRNY
jgi:hypothetical protein